ncbi:MAG: hypothetical protein K2X32_10975 [Phycisphaerales bacterium]|nr:hypothetical protein [Phycisphaerales bacterium]
MKTIKLFVAATVACASLGISSTARATLVEFTFGGVITSTTTTPGPTWSPPSAFPSVQVGQAWSMRYVFESASNGTGTQPRVFNGAIRQMQLTIGSSTLALPLPPQTTAPIGSITLGQSLFGDQYDTAVGLTFGGTPVATGVVLIDPTGNAFSSTSALPTTLSLDAFSNRFFFLGPLNAQNQYRGSVTFFIPAPGAAAAFAGAGVLAARRPRPRA